MSFPSSSYLAYILAALVAAVAGLATWIAILHRRFARLSKQYARLMIGTDGANLEEALVRHVDQVRAALETVSALETRTGRAERTLKHALQWIGMIRYNPFRNTGGAQSFALAIVDGRGNGVVLSSLHSRENTRVYAKPLHNWVSPHALTEEEEQAIERARSQHA